MRSAVRLRGVWDTSLTTVAYARTEALKTS